MQPRCVQTASEISHCGWPSAVRCLDDGSLLVAEDPTWALARILGLFHPAEPPVPGVHASALEAEGNPTCTR